MLLSFLDHTVEHLLTEVLALTSHEPMVPLYRQAIHGIVSKRLDNDPAAVELDDGEVLHALTEAHGTMFRHTVLNVYEEKIR